MLKRLLLICMCAAMLQVPTAFASGGTQVVDTCDDFSKVFEKSDAWDVETEDAASFAGDAGVFMRSSATEIQYITYQLPRVESAEIEYYYYTLDKYRTAVKIKGSSDNISWEEIAITNSNPTDIGDDWLSVKFNTSTIPEGVKYIRIEIDTAANKKAWCGIGKVTLVQGESNYVNTPIPEVGEYIVTEDDCMNFDMLYDKSANWRVETGADQWDDEGRITKSTDTGTEYLVYKVPSVFKMDMELYCLNRVLEPLEFVTVETSPDGTVYTEAESQSTESQALSDKLTYTVSFAFPEGTEYIKISVAQTNYSATWWLMFKNFKFYSVFPYEIKSGDIQVNETTAVADYTVKVNYKVYDNITMYVAAYDEAGLLLNITAETKPAEAGEVQLTKELTLPDGTSEVKVFFLNCLQGMHRVCETK